MVPSPSVSAVKMTGLVIEKLLIGRAELLELFTTSNVKLAVSVAIAEAGMRNSTVMNSLFGMSVGEFVISRYSSHQATHLGP